MRFLPLVESKAELGKYKRHVS